MAKDTYPHFIYIEFPANARTAMACGLVTLDDGSLQLVIAGGFDLEIKEAVDSTLVFSYQDASWRLGAPLPTPLNLASSVPYGNTFLVVGGDTAPAANEVKVVRDILEYYPEGAGDWILRAERLEHPRADALAFLVPSVALDCRVK